MNLRCWLASAVLGATSLGGALQPVEAKLAAWVDAHAGEFADELEAAVRIDSATENLAGVRRLGEHFAAQLTGLGFEARFVELPAATGRAGHLVAERKGTQGRRVLLLGHLDTVLPGGELPARG